MKITLPINAIKAVAFAMAKNDVREYLNGMLIEHNGAETRLVASDGARINAAIIDNFDDGFENGKKASRALPVIEPIAVIVPRKLIEAICKTKGRAETCDIEFDETTVGKAPTRVIARLADCSEAIATLINRNYPDYRRVIPKEPLSGETADYNQQYLADANAALLAWLGIAKWKSHGYKFAHNGEGAGGYLLPGFCALIMPMRKDYDANVADPRFFDALARGHH